MLKWKRGRLKLFLKNNNFSVQCLTTVDDKDYNQETLDYFNVVSIDCPNCYMGTMEDGTKCPLCLGKNKVFVLQNYKEQAVLIDSSIICPNNSMVCNTGYACDACPYNEELK
jgi:hypothetical protein